jgi:Helix-turn-helix domain
MSSKSDPPTKQRAGAEFVRRSGHELPTNGALKLKPAAAYLGGLSVPTMHRPVKSGRLRPCRQVRHLLFSRAELERFLNS